MLWKTELFYFMNLYFAKLINFALNSHMENKICMIYVTFPNKESAMSIAKYLISNKLAACCNIFPSMTSIYEWNSQIELSEEFVMIIKTTDIHFKKIENYISENHPYEIPCIINLSQGTVNEKYYQWMLNTLT